jgi:hypothetical protein
MSIGNLKRSALGLPTLDPTVLITKTLISAVIALASCVGLAAAASADPNPANTGPNPYSGLSCNCRETAPPDSPAVSNTPGKPGGSLRLVARTTAADPAQATPPVISSFKKWFWR